MGLFDNLVGAGLDALGLGESISGGGGGGQSLADAYKGDGPLGIGKFLEGIAAAYLKEHREHTETVNRLRDVDKAKLDAAITHALDHFLNSQYHKDNAIVDARAARDNAYHTYADEYLPQLHGRICSHGLWNSTAAQLLANDAYARTTVKAAELELQTIKDYAAIHANEGQLANALFGSLINAYQNTAYSEDSEKRPDVEEFAKDAAIFATFLGVLSLFSKRKYLAEGVTSGGSGTGLWDWLPTTAGTILG